MTLLSIAGQKDSVIVAHINDLSVSPASTN